MKQTLIAILNIFITLGTDWYIETLANISCEPDLSQSIRYLNSTCHFKYFVNYSFLEPLHDFSFIERTVYFQYDY
jgi:hypothetical protein